MIRIFFFLSVVLAGLNTFGQDYNKELLIGKWNFEKFEMEGISPTEKKTLEEANRKNKGLQISFTNDNKFKSSQKNGLKVNNVTGVYKLLPNNIIKMYQEPVKVIQLDKDYLKFYRDANSPVAIFRRQK